MPAFTYKSPLAEGGAAVTEFLERRRAEQREQLMLELRREQAESTMAAQAEDIFASEQRRELAGPAAQSLLDTQAATRDASEASTASSEANRLAGLFALSEGSPGDPIPKGMSEELRAFGREQNLIDPGKDVSEIVGGSGVVGGPTFRGNSIRRQQDTDFENIRNVIAEGGTGPDYANKLAVASRNYDPLVNALTQQATDLPGFGITPSGEMKPYIDPSTGLPVPAGQVNNLATDYAARAGTQPLIEQAGTTPDGIPVWRAKNSMRAITINPETGQPEPYLGPITPIASRSQERNYTIPPGIAEADAESDNLRDALIGQMRLEPAVERLVLDDVANTALLNVPEKQLAIIHAQLGHIKPEEAEEYMLAMRRFRMTAPGPSGIASMIDGVQEWFGYPQEEESPGIGPDMAAVFESLRAGGGSR